MRLKGIILFIKVFAILLALGVIFPYIINIILIKFNIINDQLPSGNSVFVMYRENGQLSFKDILYNIFYNFVDFYRK